MKKGFKGILLILSMLLMSGCTFSKESKPSPERITLETSKAIIESLQENDKQMLKELFCPYIKENYSQLDAELDKLFNFMKGEIIHQKEFAAYWATTSSNGFVSNLLRQGSRHIKGKFEALLRGETIKTPIDEHIVYNQLNNNEEVVWSLLLASGYLKVLGREKECEDEDDLANIYELTITNFETRKMFESMVRDWFGQSSYEYNEFVKAMLADDKKAMNAYMNRVARESFSYFDVGKRNEPERFH